MAVLTQAGDGNVSRQYTYGASNSANVLQEGNSNQAMQLQGLDFDGTYVSYVAPSDANVADVHQDGDGNISLQEQNGAGSHLSEILQTGNGNNATSSQWGNNHISNITHTGNGNVANVYQSN
jgi:hypothetical protein